ncbi:peptidase, partial [Pseudoalteromonas ruthenica]
QGARSPSALSLDDLLSQTYDHIFNNKEQLAMGKKLAQRVQFLTAKKLADLSISEQVDPEVQAQLRFYLTQLVEEYTQSGLFNDVSKGESAFKQFLS